MNEERATERGHIATLPSISVVVLVLGVAWIALDVWKTRHTFYPSLPGPSFLSGTHYWEDDRIARVDWKWKRTGVEFTDSQGVPTLRCLVEGKITNDSSADTLIIYSAELLLQDGNTMTLSSYSKSFSRRALFDAGEELIPQRSVDFDFSMDVEKGLLKDIKSLSARLGYNRKRASTQNDAAGDSTAEDSPSQ